MVTAQGETPPCMLCGGSADLRTESTVTPVSHKGAAHILDEFGTDIAEGSIYTCIACAHKMGHVWSRMAEPPQEASKGSN